MKQNILVVSYDYDYSKQIASKLAGLFSMHLFDELELFEFDHMPRSYEEIFETLGKEYIYKKLRSIVKSEVEFDDAVFVADISFADYSEDLFYKLKLSNFVVLLTKPIELEMEELKNKVYKTKAEKELFSTNRKTLEIREDKIIKNLADIIVDADNLTDEQIIEEIVDKIKSYYNVN